LLRAIFSDILTAFSPLSARIMARASMDDCGAKAPLSRAEPAEPKGTATEPSSTPPCHGVAGLGVMATV
jgi:hypothetical protein